MTKLQRTAIEPGSASLRDRQRELLFGRWNTRVWTEEVCKQLLPRMIDYAK